MSLKLFKSKANYFGPFFFFLFSRNTIGMVSFSINHYRRYMLIYLIIGDNKFELLVKWCLAVITPEKPQIFYWDLNLCKYFISHNIFTYWFYHPLLSLLETSIGELLRYILMYLSQLSGSYQEKNCHLYPLCHKSKERTKVLQNDFSINI